MNCKILEQRKNYFPASLYHSFKHPFQVQKASFCYYYAPNDPNPYLDFYNNVTHIGHSNSAVLKAVQQAYSTINIHTRYLNKNLTNYVEKLQKYLPKGYKMLFTNSGSEANDLALQIALKAHKNGTIGSFERSYHGTTWLCNQISHLTPTGVINDKQPSLNVKFFSPQSKPETLLRQSNVKSFILETIQGVGGNIQISQEWMTAIRNNVDIMICDEVQTGFGRSGASFWAWQQANIQPDIITCGKPIANGYPMGACIFKSQLECFLPNAYFNTFGGNSAACLVASTVLSQIQDKKLVQHSKIMGEFLKDELLKLSPEVTKVTGRGLYLGVNFSKDIIPKDIVQKLKQNHIIVGIGFNDVLRIKPPITIQKDDILVFIKILKQLLCIHQKNGFKRDQPISQNQQQCLFGCKKNKI